MVSREAAARLAEKARPLGDAISTESLEKGMRRLSTSSRVTTYSFGRPRSTASLTSLPLFMQAIGTRLSIDTLNQSTLVKKERELERGRRQGQEKALQRARSSGNVGRSPVRAEMDRISLFS